MRKEEATLSWWHVRSQLPPCLLHLNHAAGGEWPPEPQQALELPDLLRCPFICSPFPSSTLLIHLLPSEGGTFCHVLLTNVFLKFYMNIQALVRISDGHKRCEPSSSLLFALLVGKRLRIVCFQIPGKTEDSGPQVAQRLKSAIVSWYTRLGTY